MQTEHIRCPIDSERTALITITVECEPEIPTPGELTTHRVPTARELSEIVRNLAASRFQFAPAQP